MVFKKGDLVKIKLQKMRFPIHSFGKLKRADGSFKVIKCINNNTYNIDLPSNYKISTTFNIANLSPYYKNSNISMLKVKLLLPKEDGTTCLCEDSRQVSLSQFKPGLIQLTASIVAWPAPWGL